MRADPHVKVSERQKLSQRRRRMLGAAGSVLAVVLMTSWLSLHAWSRDILPGWMRAAANPGAILAALLHGDSLDAAVASRARHRSAPPPEGAGSQPAVTRSRAAAAIAAQGATLGTAGSADSDGTAARTEASVDAGVVEATVAAQPNPAPDQPLVDPESPVVPEPELPVDGPDPVGAVVDDLGDTLGDVVGGLVPDDFEVSLNPRIEAPALGVGAEVGLQIDETGANAALQVDTPVTPVGVITQVSLENGVATGVGVRASLVDVGVGATTSNGVGLGAAVPGAAEAGVELSSQEGVQVLVGSAPLGVDLSVSITESPNGGLLPNISIGSVGK